MQTAVSFPSTTQKLKIMLLTIYIRSEYGYLLYNSSGDSATPSLQKGLRAHLKNMTKYRPIESYANRASPPK